MIPLIAAVKPYVIHYGYWAVIGGVFFESLGLPLPGETLIIVAGLVAAKGILNITWVIIFAVLATFLANNISYLAGFYGGRNLVLKYGKYIFLNDKRLQALENFVKRHGSKVVVMARFIIGLRQINGFLAGMAKMPILRFIIYNLAGAILWVGWWTGLAYCFGKKFDNMFIQYYFWIGILALLGLMIMVFHFFKSHDENPSL